MSYTKRYHESITVSGTVSKTVTVQGQSTTVTIPYREVVPIDIEIEVDTRPFENEVESCSDSVDELTGAVVATETAHVASVAHHAATVSRTIVSGFFGTIRSEISQQITELSKNIEAQVMHLAELRKSCVAKQQQMEGDFARIASRYEKIFHDLDRELDNRIHELDKPAFAFAGESDEQGRRASATDMVGTAAVFGPEHSMVHARMCASNAKLGALRAIRKASAFIADQRRMERHISSSMHAWEKAGRSCVPVCCVETVDATGQPAARLHHAAQNERMRDAVARYGIPEVLARAGVRWRPMQEKERQQIGMSLKSLGDQVYPGIDPHVVRVREMIQRLARLDTVQTLEY